MKRLWVLLMRLCRTVLGILYHLVGAELSESRWHIWEQFIKFLLVGLSNTVVLLAVYYMVVLPFGEEYYLLGQTLGYIVGIFNSFFWNSRCVFTSAERPQGAFLRMCLCYGLTYFLQAALLYAMVDIMHLSALLSPLIAIIITTPFNFVLNKLFAFRDRRKQEDVINERYDPPVG